MVAMINERAPSPKIISDFGVRNVWAWVLAPTVKPSRIVTMSISACLADTAKRSVTVLSLRRLPKKSMPRRAIEPGAIMAQIRKATIGKIIFSFLETTRGGFMWIFLSFSVVKRYMIGGWITGTSAI